MTEAILIDVLTDVCEGAKAQNVGFVWLTHTGHWRRPSIVAVFSTEAEKHNAIAKQWDRYVIDSLQQACEIIGVKIKSVRFDSEEACSSKSKGNWQLHLKQNGMH